MLNRKKIVGAAVGALLLPVLTGCSGQSAPMTKDEQANFKGGPMPAAAREKMQAKMQGGAPATNNGR